MIPLVIDYPLIDPVAFWLGPVPVRWYGLAYAAGLLFGWLYIRWMMDNERIWRGAPPLMPEDADAYLLYIAAGVVIGGRLGFVLLYEGGYFLERPLAVFEVWKGGMAFHGGLIGCAIACWLFARRYKIPLLTAMDIGCAAVPVGIGLGRIANFINAEVYGRVSDVPWAMVFPGAGLEPRHPSQLYEAFLEGLVLFVVLRYLTHHRLKLKEPGTVTAAFLILYGSFRIFCELFRDPAPDANWLFDLGPISSGMAYSLPMILAGVVLLVIVRARARAAA
jgi:phosphatidylglycerol:prolipoprotein diacylglycerol transferase